MSFFVAIDLNADRCWVCRVAARTSARRRAINWRRTAVALCRNSDDICCLWRVIIAMTILGCTAVNRRQWLLNALQACCDARRHHLSVRRSAPADAAGGCRSWCVDDRQTAGRSRGTLVTLAARYNASATLLSSVLHYCSFQRVCCSAS